VFENHTASERAEGEADVRRHIGAILDAWPDLTFETRRYHDGPDHAVCEWTATATHTRPVSRAGAVAQPTGRRITWRGVDVFTIRDGGIARKDVYSDSVAILRAVGLIE
jgi:ketosteroid isomerase-like protein